MEIQVLNKNFNEFNLIGFWWILYFSNKKLKEFENIQLNNLSYMYSYILFYFIFI